MGGPHNLRWRTCDETFPQCMRSGSVRPRLLQWWRHGARSGELICGVCHYSWRLPDVGCDNVGGAFTLLSSGAVAG
eukprot:8800128-Prorocentrum_lima.AAC.1